MIEQQCLGIVGQLQCAGNESQGLEKGPFWDKVEHE